MVMTLTSKGEEDARQQAADAKRLEQIRESADGDYCGGEGEGLETAVDDVRWLLERGRLLLVRVQELTEARFSPLGDNHHNAAACPYCGDLLGKAERRVQEVERALRQLIDATGTGHVYAAIMQAEAVLGGDVQEENTTEAMVEKINSLAKRYKKPEISDASN